MGTTAASVLKASCKNWASVTAIAVEGIGVTVRMLMCQCQSVKENSYISIFRHLMA